VFDAFFYARTMVEGARFEALAARLRHIAGQEVDSLGHVFIYTTTALRLIPLCAGAARNLVLLALMEYIARKARVRTAARLSEERSLRDLLPGAFERINILGHNVIYAEELRRSLSDFDPEMRTHLLGQLARNIHDAKSTLTREAYDRMLSDAPDGDGSTQARIEAAFREDDLPAGIGAVGHALEQPDGLTALRDALLPLFARIDTPQPHYLIYPAATFALLDGAPEALAPLAVGQLVQKGIRAAKDNGLRQADAIE
jgi:hypothetical protein